MSSPSLLASNFVILFAEHGIKKRSPGSAHHSTLPVCMLARLPACCKLTQHARNMNTAIGIEKFMDLAGDLAGGIAGLRISARRSPLPVVPWHHASRNLETYRLHAEPG